MARTVRYSHDRRPRPPRYVGASITFDCLECDPKQLLVSFSS